MPENPSPTMHPLAGSIRPRGHMPGDRYWLETRCTSYLAQFRDSPGEPGDHDGMPEFLQVASDDRILTLTSKPELA